MRILITGATGWVGGALMRALREQGHDIVAAIRLSANLSSVKTVQMTAINGTQSWPDWLSDRQVVLHCAARVHVMADKSKNPIEEYRRTNVFGTLSLARQAAGAGVRRFVFISSIKVNGEATALGRPFFADDIAAPLDPYGISKMEAEQGLRDIATTTGMEVVIIRPPLVYGPGVKANFQSLMRWLARGVPLPLGSINNRRSLVALDNLVDLITTCISHPAAANQTFLVSDDEDLSTTQLLQRMGQVIGRPAQLIPVPPALLKVGARLVGKPELAQRLCGSLQVDISKPRQLLGWNPPISVDEGLHRAAEGGGHEASN